MGTQTLIGLEASGHLWENLEAALVGAGYRVLVLVGHVTGLGRPRPYAMLKHRQPYNPSRLLVATAKIRT
jgi:hypothetical protein